MIMGDDLGKMLCQVKGTCPKCNNVFTFQEGVDFKDKYGISDNVVMCPKCGKTYTIDMNPSKMTLVNDVSSKYNINFIKADNSSMKTKAGRNAIIVIITVFLITAAVVVFLGGVDRYTLGKVLFFGLGVLAILYRKSIFTKITASFLFAVLFFIVPFTQLTFWTEVGKEHSRIEKVASSASTEGYIWVDGGNNYIRAATEKEVREHIAEELRRSGTLFENKTQNTLYIIFLFSSCYMIGLFLAYQGIKLLKSVRRQKTLSLKG